MKKQSEEEATPEKLEGGTEHKPDYTSDKSEDDLKEKASGHKTSLLEAVINKVEDSLSKVEASLRKKSKETIESKSSDAKTVAGDNTPILEDIPKVQESVRKKSLESLNQDKGISLQLSEELIHTILKENVSQDNHAVLEGKDRSVVEEEVDKVSQNDIQEGEGKGTCTIKQHRMEAKKKKDENKKNPAVSESTTQPGNQVLEEEYNKTTPACQSPDDNDVHTNNPPIQDKIDDVVVKDISKPKELSKQEEADYQVPDNEKFSNKSPLKEVPETKVSKAKI